MEQFWRPQTINFMQVSICGFWAGTVREAYHIELFPKEVVTLCLQGYALNVLCVRWQTELDIGNATKTLCQAGLQQTI